MVSSDIFPPEITFFALSHHTDTRLDYLLHIVDAVVARTECGDIVEGGSHSNRSVSILHVQLVDVQGLHWRHVYLRYAYNARRKTIFYNKNLASQ